ncbi:MAG: hypothetical protein IIA62_03055 [Nitrospinae bacterium]|nr:hypothetical protein [Nitrospinota bacterium]
MEVRTSANGTNYAGKDLIDLINNLIQYQDFTDTLVKNNIPSGIINALVKLDIDKENFQNLNNVIKTVIEITNNLIDEKNRKKYKYNEKYFNVPLVFKEGLSVNLKDQESLRKLNIDLEQSSENGLAAKTSHGFERIDLDDNLKEIKILIDRDPENELYSFTIFGRRRGREYNVKFSAGFFESPIVHKLYELYKPIRKLDHPPFTLINKNEEQQVDSREDLLNAVLEAGKSGMYIQRYKGLGEMNPEQLWETTMDPEKRVLLQVRADDLVESELIFSTLMGDAVEPRREFIQTNALDVRNLDI